MQVDDPKNAQMSIFTFGLKDIKANELPVTQLTISAINLRDPTGSKSFHNLDGRSGLVQKYLSDDPRVDSLLDDICRTVADIRTVNGANWVSVSIYDHHGKMSSVALAELLGERIKLRLPALNYKITHIGLLKDKSGFMRK